MFQNEICRFEKRSLNGSSDDDYDKNVTNWNKYNSKFSSIEWTLAIVQAANANNEVIPIVPYSKTKTKTRYNRLTWLLRRTSLLTDQIHSFEKLNNIRRNSQIFFLFLFVTHPNQNKFKKKKINISLSLFLVNIGPHCQINVNFLSLTKPFSPHRWRGKGFVLEYIRIRSVAPVIRGKIRNNADTPPRES